MEEGGRGVAGMMRICFHGAESTGKTTFARRLADELGAPWVPEYGRKFAETRGTDFTMADLLEIAESHDAATRAASAGDPPLVILDTDPLMTAAWAEMLFSRVPEALFDYPRADHYLLFAPDTPWVADGTRFFGTPGERHRFAELSEAMLVRAGVSYERIAGDWDERINRARAAIQARMAVAM